MSGDEGRAGDGEAPEPNPVIRRVVEKAVAPFVGKVSPEELANMRAAIADLLATHPHMSDLVRSLHDRPVRQRSDDMAIDEGFGEQAPSAPVVSKKAVGGGS